MADVVIAALHQRRERFLTLMLQSCLADSGALKTNNHPGQLESGKRRGGGQMGRGEEEREETVRPVPPEAPPFLPFFINNFILPQSLWRSGAASATQP